MSQAIARTLLTTGAGTGHWTLDAASTSVRIASKTMWGAVTVKGDLAARYGDALVSPEGTLTGALTIDAKSVDTKNKKRDEHLRSAEFFDVAAHPDIQIGVLSASLVADDELQLQCELTVKGVREPIELLAHVLDATPSAVTLLVETDIDRERFGLSWNKMGMIKGLTTVTVRAVFARAS